MKERKRNRPGAILPVLKKTPTLEGLSRAASDFMSFNDRFTNFAGSLLMGRRRSYPGNPFIRKLTLIFKLAILLALVALIPFNVYGVHGQGGFEVTDVEVAYNFGEQITFQAHLQAPLPILQASILFREVNEEVTRVETLQVGVDGSVSYTYNASQNVLPPFSMIVFWFQVRLADGQTYTSAPVLFRYEDNRFPWRAATGGPLTVHWYAGEDAFGQAALDAAGAGMSSMRAVVPLSLDEPVEIYIYSNVADLQDALQLGGEDWTGGHADPELGVVMVSIAPGEAQSIEMETEIPHELAHVMLFRLLGEGYPRLPVWLREGIASDVELYPNPDYAQALRIAAENDSLLHFKDLCDSFPPDSGRAFLAYAQSQSFVTYLRDTYGLTGLGALSDAYSEDLGCEIGATRALGVPLSQLEANWRETVLGQNNAGVAMRNLSPFVLLMALMLIIPLWGAIDMLRRRRKRGRQSE